MSRVANKQYGYFILGGIYMTKDKKLRLRALCEGAILVAAAQLLGYLKIYEFPQGGSITLGMLPIFLYCARWGFGPGMLASIAYSLLQLFLDGAYAWGWQSMLGDYIIAFSVLGIAGAFYKMKGGFFIGTVVGCVARFLVHLIVGATVWADTMPESFFGMTMTSPWFYSVLYNGSYMIVDMILVIVVGAILWKPMKKYFTGADLRRG
jgi:thiamine transporter